MRAERRPVGSTGGTALVYPAPMNARSLIIPALLLLIDSVGCKDETLANTPGEFGDPCIPGAEQDSPNGCVAGTKCHVGFCQEECAEDSDCQVISGWTHVCVTGLCQILCDDEKGCPESLGTPMTCEVSGTAQYCEAKEES